ncbi:MAG: FtsW/RodA/SpoVE family cell cycle protein [Saprospiraceae bacterium]
MSTVKSLYQILKGDKWIWGMFFIMGLFSILIVYSSSGAMAYKYAGGNTEFYLIKQFVFIALGFGVATACYNVHYLHYSRLAPILLAIAIPLLFYTLFFGPEYNDARRWINIPWINQRFQTSDFAKIALIIFVARSLAIRQDFIKDFKSAFVPIIVPVIIVCGLIMPADLSTAGLLFVTSLLMMFIGRVSLKYVGLLLLLGAIVFGILFIIGTIFPEVFRVETWMSRVQEYMSSGDGDYQVQQSKIAIANGGFFGLGPGNSLQKNFLPYAYADFIYAIICEEYGILGGIVILLMYLVLLFRCIKIVTQCPKAFGAILAMGLCLNIVIQAFANIAVSVQLVPVTGLTLPLISMGGTSLLFTSASIGVILSVSRYVEQSNNKRIALEKLEAIEHEGNN